MIETAFAKINLALHVRRRRPDGYHDIETLFAFAEDGDVLSLENEGPPLSITGPFAAAIAGETERNLVIGAARAFEDVFGAGAPAAFRLDKRLPVAAGVGGGSADGAAALRLLARRAGVPIDERRLMAIAAGLGADVPACLLSRPVRGEGRGDVLEMVDEGGLAGLPLLLVNPGVAIATGPVFAGWDGVDRGALDRGDPLDVAEAGRNDLEPGARAVSAAVDAVLALLRGWPGTLLTRMSGSGATCFSLFETMAARDAAAADVAQREPGWWRLATRLREAAPC